MALPKNPTQLEVVKAVNDKVSKTDNETITGVKTFTQRPKLSSGGESILPDGYQQVEYIAASGTQYIDTGYTASLNTDIELEFAFTSLGENHKSVFGSRTGAYENDNIEVVYSSVLGTRQLLVDFGNATNYRTYGVIGAGIKYRVICNKNQRTIYNGDQIVAQSTRANTNTFTGTYNLYLFATNNGIASALNLDGRFYNCKIRENNTLVRNFIPCYRKSDNEIGMYDIVNDEFYTNAGTGTFTKGDNVVASSDFATLDDIPSVPTKTSDLTNDSGFITSADISGKANDNAVVHLAGNETIAGTKSFSSAINVGGINNTSQTHFSFGNNIVEIGFLAPTLAKTSDVASGLGCAFKTKQLMANTIYTEKFGYKISTSTGSGKIFNLPTSKADGTYTLATTSDIPSVPTASDTDYTNYIGEI